METRDPSKSLEMLSPHPPEECARLLREAIDRERSFLFPFQSMFGSKPVTGKVNGSGFRIRKRIGYQNSFQLLLTGTLESEGTGTAIHGTFAMHPFVQGFLMIWCTGVVLIGGAAVIQAPFQSSDTPFPWLFLPILGGMLVFANLLKRFGRYLSRNEPAFLAGFLRNTLDATEPADSP
jgi:hypothetical protein